MDVGLFLAVLRRSKRLVIAGGLLALVVAVLSYGTPSISDGHPTITPRSAEVWQSESQLLIGQSAYPYRQAPEASEPSRALGSLSPIYANVANGNIVQGEIRRQLGTGGSVKASEDVDLAASSFLPFVNFVATASTPAEAARFARGGVTIFKAYVARQQIANGVPPNRRIELSVVQSGADPKLAEGHKLSIPILVFVAVMIATIALVLVRENVRRQATAIGETRSIASLPSDPDMEAAPAHARPTGAADGAAAVHRERVITGSVQR